MMFMLLFMVVMTFMLMSEAWDSMGSIADPYLSSWLPSDKWFVITVLILGSISMFVNTALRNVFMGSSAQTHIGHRQGQVRKMMNEARTGRSYSHGKGTDTTAAYDARTDERPQMGAMKPMMFSWFSLSLFSSTWMGTAVGDFRVSYVSLPWAPGRWNLRNWKVPILPSMDCNIHLYVCSVW